MRCFGDAGFIPAEIYTSANLSKEEARALREKENTSSDKAQKAA